MLNRIFYLCAFSMASFYGAYADEMIPDSNDQTPNQALVFNDEDLSDDDSEESELTCSCKKRKRNDVEEDVEIFAFCDECDEANLFS